MTYEQSIQHQHPPQGFFDNAPQGVRKETAATRARSVEAAAGYVATATGEINTVIVNFAEEGTNHEQA